MNRFFAKAAKTQNLMWAGHEGNDDYHEMTEVGSQVGAWSTWAEAKPGRSTVVSEPSESVMTADKVTAWLNGCPRRQITEILRGLTEERLAHTSLAASELVSRFGMRDEDDVVDARSMSSGVFDDVGMGYSSDESGRGVRSSPSSAEISERAGEASTRPPPGAASPADTGAATAAGATPAARATDARRDEAVAPSLPDEASAQIPRVPPTSAVRGLLDADEDTMPLLSAMSMEVELEHPALWDITDPSLVRDAPIVQFSAFEIIAGEEESEVEVEVLRIGNLSSSADVAFQTVDGTAVAGVVYQETSGICHFEPGEDSARIVVPIIDDDQWRTTQEFYVDLLPENLRGAQLGPGLRRVKVVVIDNDTFPTNAYQEEIKNGVKHSRDLHEIEFGVSDHGLVVEFFKFLWQNSFLRRGSIKVAMVDLCHSLFMVLKLLLNVVLVDHVLKATRAASFEVLETNLVMIAACSVVPFGVLHYFDYCKTFWRVPGTAKALIQTSLVYKFLDFEPGVRSEVNHGGIIMAITRDAVQIIDKGYMCAFALTHSVTNVAMLLGYQFLAAFALDASINMTCIAAMLVYPMILFVFVYCRRRTTTYHLKEMQRRQDGFVDKVDALVQNLELVKAFSESDFFMRQFQASLVEFNGAATENARVLLNNARFPQWLSVIAVGIYTVIGGKQVVAAELSLGSFLANVRTLYSAGQNWGGIYSNVLMIQSCVPNLQRIVVLQNLSLEVVSRRPFAKNREVTGRRLRRKLSSVDALGGGDEAGDGDGTGHPRWAPTAAPVLGPDLRLHGMSSGVPAVDLMPLRVPIGPGAVASDRDFIEIKQGRMVYLIGPHGGGKSALLALLALSELPESVEEGVFVPSHLRVMYITSESRFFFGTLRENLLLGVGKDQGYPDDQIRDICKRLGLPNSVQELIGSEDKQQWGATLPMTQRLLLSLARVLIASPDMLCIGKYLQHFDDFTKKKLLQVLRDFVDLRGLCQDPTLRHLRRPRTVIMTTNTRLDPSFADEILLVNRKGIQVVKTEGERRDMTSP